MVSEDQFFNAFFKFRDCYDNYNNDETMIKRINGFLSGYNLTNNKNEIFKQITQIISLFKLTKEERTNLSFESSTPAHFENVKTLKNLNKLLSFVKSMDKWKHPEAVVNRYKIDKELIRKDIEELEHWTKHQGKKRSHLTEIKNRLKIIYTILENNDFSSTKKDEFVYTLFCEFEFEHYGKGIYLDEQMENIKKIRLDCERDPGFHL